MWERNFWKGFDALSAKNGKVWEADVGELDNCCVGNGREELPIAIERFVVHVLDKGFDHAKALQKAIVDQVHLPCRYRRLHSSVFFTGHFHDRKKNVSCAKIVAQNAMESIIRIVCSGPFRYAVIDECSQLSLFTHPLTLSRLAFFLIDALQVGHGKFSLFLAGKIPAYVESELKAQKQAIRHLREEREAEHLSHRRCSGLARRLFHSQVSLVW